MRGCHAANQFTLFSKSRHGSEERAVFALPQFLIHHPHARGGGDRIRTDDRLVANQVLYQLSYAPSCNAPEWWAWVDLNH